MGVRTIAFATTALACLAGSAGATEDDPNLTNDTGHPQHETEATAGTGRWDADDGSKNHYWLEHSPAPTVPIERKEPSTSADTTRPEPSSTNSWK